MKKAVLSMMSAMLMTLSANAQVQSLVLSDNHAMVRLSFAVFFIATLQFACQSTLQASWYLFSQGFIFTDV